MDLNLTRTEIALLREAEQQQAEAEAWDAEMPDWEAREVDPEDARFIAEQDVENAEDFTVQSGPGWARLVNPANG